jgi:hypothetical protein
VEVFFDVGDARAKLEQWRADFNHSRPHSSLNDRTPREFRAAVAAQPFALPTVDNAVSTAPQGFAHAGNKTPALDRAAAMMTLVGCAAESTPLRQSLPNNFRSRIRFPTIPLHKGGNA